jgi:hypothetical protein
VGNFPGFGEVYYDERCVANILCFHDLTKRFEVKFEQRTNSFEVYEGGRVVMLFVPKNKLYIWNPRTDQDKVETVLVETVGELERQFTQREIEQARKIHYQLYDVMKGIFLDGNPGGIKALLETQGICSNYVRLPLAPVNPSVYNHLRELNQKIKASFIS